MSYAPDRDPYRSYREQQVNALGTGRLVLLALETALRACRTGRRGLLARVLTELMAGLDLEQGEIASGLFRLYEYCLWQSREGRVDEVQRVLAGLRDAWEQAVRAEESRGAGRTSAAVLAG